ncbi:hypothetical protein CEV31_2772 [Brucella thiophenivorans]|uniref:Uncharacterized protein n=1 Tax=Brucella thiophenivorans TaxID=571255 RepID=A0A256FMJ2_9HYPH|nr:hypothetical protein CEV31_2772 [Brucella thiophenivorans]
MYPPYSDDMRGLGATMKKLARSAFLCLADNDNPALPGLNG